MAACPKRPTCDGDPMEYYDLAYETPWWRWFTIKSGLKTAVEGGKRVKGLVP